MRRLSFVLGMLLLTLALAVPALAQDDGNTIIDALAADPAGQFTTLLAAIDAAGLTDALSAEGDFTVFAPTNDAIAAALEAMGMTQEDMLANPDVLAAILQYHVVPGERLFFRHLLGRDTLTTLQGEDIGVELNVTIILNGVASVTDVDNIASNGVIHFIDAVLVPPSVEAAMTSAPEATEAPAEPTEAPVVAAPTTTDVLAEGGYTTLAAAIEAAGLTDAINSGTFTIFAPTDDAFAAALEMLAMTADDLMANPDLLTAILTYHVVPDEQLFFRHLLGRDSLTTLQGEDLSVALATSIVLNDAATVTDPDNIAGNSVFHAIDTVLIPPSVLAVIQFPAEAPEATEAPAEPTEAPVVAAPTTTEVLAADGYTTLVAAIDAAGLTDTLNSGTFTIFVPTNDAIAAALEAMGISQEDMLANPDVLTAILTYHAVPDEQLFFRHLLGHDSLTTLEGEDVSVELNVTIILNGVASLTDPDNIAGNSVFHVIDAVLIPPALQSALMPTPEATEAPVEPTPAPEVTPEPTEAPVEATEVPAEPTEAPPNTALDYLANDGQFTLLVAAIEAAGLSDALSAEGPLTLFAPTDDAITAALETLGMTQEDLLANPDVLAAILQYHVVPGEALFFRHLLGRDTLTSLQGEDIAVALDTTIVLNGAASVVDPDNVVDNGVINVIDAVLLPPSVAAMLAPEPTPEATAAPEITAIENPAYVRVGYFSPDAPALDLFINGEATPDVNISFPALGGWAVVQAGTYTLNLAPAGAGMPGEIFGPVDFTFVEGTWTTLAVVGSEPNGTMLAQIVLEDYSAIADGDARVTFFNGIENGAPVDVVVNDATVISRLGYPGQLGDNDGAFVVDLAAGQSDIQFTVSGSAPDANDPSSQVVLLDLPDVNLEAGSHYFIALVGPSGAPSSLVESTDTATVDALR